MTWSVIRTEQFDAWTADLDERQLLQLAAALRVLRKDGPQTRRPHVDTVKGSRFPNMKELRTAGTLRVLFAFDPQRQAVLLVGGDKRGRKGWYAKAIATADRLYEEHLAKLER